VYKQAIVVGILVTLSRGLACALARGLPVYIVFSSPLLVLSIHNSLLSFSFSLEY
jgi:hypothetical protein